MLDPAHPSRPRLLALALAASLAFTTPVGRPQNPTPAPAPQQATDTPQATTSGDGPNSADGKPAKQKANQPIRQQQWQHPVLWTRPENIASLDMLNGIGGEKHVPVPPFVFEAEDLGGTNPKFDVRDANGKKWRVKLGEESRPETTASRLLWAAGYFVDQEYTLPSIQVQGLKMKRNVKPWTAPDGSLVNARFKRKPGGEKKIGIWEWKSNPFLGQREFNGLRVMMAVLNNWDLKDVNNAVYVDPDDPGRQEFMVSDLGASFATNSIELHRSIDKGNVDSYRKSKFITGQKPEEVSFGTPGSPNKVLFASFGGSIGDYAQRKGFDWIGEHIPRGDAKWIGDMLGQLSHQQLQDAFKAGGFPPAQIDEYVMLLQNRIQLLKGL